MLFFLIKKKYIYMILKIPWLVLSFSSIRNIPKEIHNPTQKKMCKSAQHQLNSSLLLRWCAPSPGPGLSACFLNRPPAAVHTHAGLGGTLICSSHIPCLTAHTILLALCPWDTVILFLLQSIIFLRVLAPLHRLLILPGCQLLLSI